ncbi:unnamed protein product [Periconia digitata]|uniref:Uncharacterized protein n=1 Tax=Periconia digitata TaxID=1303443 RepID=A0A9W4UGY0_9PLEO|nr:unnamed protein product [Periconia digitata]
MRSQLLVYIQIPGIDLFRLSKTTDANLIYPFERLRHFLMLSIDRLFGTPSSCILLGDKAFIPLTYTISKTMVAYWSLQRLKVLESVFCGDPKGLNHQTWSHTPYCALSADGSDYCVYTSNMAGENGISLILPPSVAQETSLLINNASLNAFAESHTRRPESAVSQDASKDDSNTTPPYEVRAVPGKGKGVIATRRIKKWETIMVDQAAVVIDRGIKKAVSESTRKQLMKKATKQLRNPDAVLELSGDHDAHGEKGNNRENNSQIADEQESNGLANSVEYILQTNGFGATVAGVKCRALFPLISVLHSLLPNKPPLSLCDVSRISVDRQHTESQS